jgi:tetratricopeptide (TPR) repeat protein
MAAQPKAFPTRACILCVALVLSLVAGCKPSGGSSQSHGYFHTHFQDESQFIVETIVSDLAEQVYYAKYRELPDAKKFSVAAMEKPGSSFDAPVYDVQIVWGGKARDLQTELKIAGPIWSAGVYDGLTAALAGAVGLTATGSDGHGDTKLLSKLADGTATTIEKENQNLSGALEDDFSNPVLHEKAAVLLGAFTLREHSGDFFEIRSPLCRMTAHLAMARFLAGKNSPGVNGRVAEATLLILMNDQSAALEKLNGIATNDAAVTSWVRALQTRNTGDYRPLDNLNGLSSIECVEWFRALAKSVNLDVAWLKLSDAQRQTVDFVRIADGENCSVEVGHPLFASSLSLELAELDAVHQLSRGKKINESQLAGELNELPERCFARGAGKQIHVRVIGWGQWAMFFQRHLCHAVQADFNFMQEKWGVPDDAKDFSANCERLFGGLRLYPFVRRFDCTDVDSYHKSVDDGFRVTVETPQLVPAECWNYLCYRTTFTELYQPNPNPHVNEWHSHNPPPGTVYDILPRLNHPSLVGRPDSAARLDTLHDAAPYDRDISYFILKTKYNSRPTEEQATALLQPVLPYAAYAMETVAATVAVNNPGKYEKLVSQAATLDPALYFTLGNYFVRQQQDDKAAQYYQKGDESGSDSVLASYYAGWQVQYYLGKGQKSEAGKIATAAGETYSSAGLQAQADYFEAISNYDSAFQCLQKIEERYNEPGPLMLFCTRYKLMTGDVKFDGEVESRLGKLFPKGIEIAGLHDFHAAPTDGVLVRTTTVLAQSAGLRTGDVITAVYGVRVHNFAQYDYARDISKSPELDLIVWQEGEYREIKASPPHHRFGGDFGDYAGK